LTDWRNMHFNTLTSSQTLLKLEKINLLTGLK
jgi:hypothetical protein